VKRKAADVESGTRLEISVSDAIRSPSPSHSLLIGFHFGRPHPNAVHPAVVSLELSPLDHEHIFESWWYRGNVSASRQGAAQIAECDDYSVVTLKTDRSGNDDFQAVTRRSYEELVAAVRETAHRQIIKIWNYVGGINIGQGDLERYRQFSVGRAAAFRALGIEDEDAPTGTAIGTSSETGLTLIALASKHKFGLAENPRQVSAFHYPRRYGPSSPRFSRGGFVATGEHRLFAISGTAAVVGHESAYPFDVARQTDETLRNLSALCVAVSELDCHSPPLSLDGDGVLRVYLRSSEDLELVARKLRKAFGRSSLAVIYLQGSICRRELVVEIDGATVTKNLRRPGLSSAHQIESDGFGRFSKV
jgi:chorismate lyase / 3-hydroxybenzoate synthase